MAEAAEVADSEDVAVDLEEDAAVAVDLEAEEAAEEEDVAAAVVLVTAVVVAEVAVSEIAAEAVAEDAVVDAVEAVDAAPKKNGCPLRSSAVWFRLANSRPSLTFSCTRSASKSPRSSTTTSRRVERAAWS